MAQQNNNQYSEQNTIKSAVTAPESEPQGDYGMSAPPPSNQSAQDYSNTEQVSAQSSNQMQPSMLGAPEEDAAYQPQYSPQQGQAEYAGYPAQTVQPSAYSQQDYYQTPSGYGGSYQNYSQYQGSYSSDTINEIAEQVFYEKISPIRKVLDNTLDLKSKHDTKIQAIDERLRRIEKILDTLQIEILQKVGKSISNVEDLRNELIETQKSFKALTGKSSSKKK